MKSKSAIKLVAKKNMLVKPNPLLRAAFPKVLENLTSVCRACEALCVEKKNFDQADLLMWWKYNFTKSFLCASLRGMHARKASVCN